MCGYAMVHTCKSRQGFLFDATRQGRESTGTLQAAPRVRAPLARLATYITT